MKRHNGFILADVVGLGKTIVGILIIKRFLEDAYIEGRERKVLIVTPPAIKKSWGETIKTFDIKDGNNFAQHITFITTGSIGKLIDDSDDEIADNADIEIGKTEKYGLILIDESHKFRNSSTQMYRKINDLIDSIFPNPYIVLLSATPQNNSPQDLKNQIYLFQREHNNTTLDKIGGRKLDTFFVEKERQFQALKKQPNNAELVAILKDIREKVLDDLVVRRTRSDIKKYYPKDAENLKFPEIKGPNTLKYEMDEELAQLFYDTMEIIAPYDVENNEFAFKEGSLQYFRYRAIEFFTKPEHRKLYEKRNLTVENTSKLLARIMLILLVKRLESSFAAFKTSLRNLQRYTQNMLTMLEDNTVFICPDLNVNDELNFTDKNGKFRSKTESYEAIRQKIRRKQQQKSDSNNNREFCREDFSNAYIEGLKRDKEIIDLLCERWDKFSSYDPKLERFKDAINNELFDNKINNPHGYDKQKLVIFTEAIATMEELKRQIKVRGKRKVLAITAANRDAMQETIKVNFDANAEEKRDDYDIIITTEVLAEGVNLHRANVIVNYDTPWNSTRLMQRIGRVNRIGSQEDFVYVYNFLPTAQSEHQIHLVRTAHTKLQAFHAVFGEDSQIYTKEEELPDYNNDPAKFREMLDGEESVYERFIAELKSFRDKNPTEYQRIAELKTPIFVAKKSKMPETVCVVKTDNGKGLYIAVGEQETKNIPTIAMLEKLQCTPETQSSQLPENLTKIHERAKTEYRAFFDRMITARQQDKKTKKALGIIKKIYSKTTIQNSRELLIIARKLVNGGNVSLANKMINLNEISNQSSLFPIVASDFDSLIQSELAALKNRAAEQTATPEIILSTSNIK